MTENPAVTHATLDGTEPPHVWLLSPSAPSGSAELLVRSKPHHPAVVPDSESGKHTGLYWHGGEIKTWPLNGDLGARLAASSAGDLSPQLLNLTSDPGDRGRW